MTFLSNQSEICLRDSSDDLFHYPIKEALFKGNNPNDMNRKQKQMLLDPTVMEQNKGWIQF